MDKIINPEIQLWINGDVIVSPVAAAQDETGPTTQTPPSATHWAIISTDSESGKSFALLMRPADLVALADHIGDAATLIIQGENAKT